MTKKTGEGWYSRRDFLKTILGVGGALLIPQDLLHLGDSPAPTIEEIMQSNPVMASESRRGGLPARDRQEVLVATDSMRKLIEGDHALTGIVDSPTDWVTLYTEFMYTLGPIPQDIRYEVRGLVSNFATQFDQCLTSSLGGGFVGQVLEIPALNAQNEPEEIVLSSASIRRGESSLVRQSLYVRDDRLKNLIVADDVIGKIVSMPTDMVSLYLGYLERTGPIPQPIGAELINLTNTMSMNLSNSLSQMRN